MDYIMTILCNSHNKIVIIIYIYVASLVAITLHVLVSTLHTANIVQNLLVAIAVYHRVLMYTR